MYFAFRQVLPSCLHGHSFPVSKEYVRAVSDLLWLLSRISLNLSCNLDQQSCRFTPFTSVLITFSWQRHPSTTYTIVILNEYIPSGGKVAGFCAASFMVVNFLANQVPFSSLHMSLCMRICFKSILFCFLTYRKKSPKQM